MTKHEEEMRLALERVWELLHEKEEGPKQLSYGCLLKFENGTSLWYEAVSDMEDGFVLRRGCEVRSQYSQKRQAYILDPDDPGVIDIYERRRERK